MSAPFWRDEKYSKTGFILEGFPSCQDDIRYIVGNGLFPDACIVIYCEEKDVIKRNLPGRLTHYKEYNKLGFQLISLSKKFSLILLVSTRY